jgi:hypothetical protein
MSDFANHKQSTAKQDGIKSMFAHFEKTTRHNFEKTAHHLEKAAQKVKAKLNPKTSASTFTNLEAAEDRGSAEVNVVPQKPNIDFTREQLLATVKEVVALIFEIAPELRPQNTANIHPKHTGLPIARGVDCRSEANKDDFLTTTTNTPKVRT